MPDDEDTTTLETRRKIVEERANALDDLPVALASGIRLVDPAQRLPLEARQRLAVQVAVVAFAQAPVPVDRDSAVRERDVSRLDSAQKVRRVGGSDVIVAASLAELAGELPSMFRQLALQPARPDPALVVDGKGMRLVDDLDADPGSLADS
jgi:hypothetical protein